MRQFRTTGKPTNSLRMSKSIAIGKSAASRLSNLVRISSSPIARLTPGLTDTEIVSIQDTYNIRFTPAHRAFLQETLPLSIPHDDMPGIVHTHPDPWPDWRDGSFDDIRAKLDWPLRTVISDIEDDKFWDESWGKKPEDREEVLNIAKEHLVHVPTLLPVYGHRFVTQREDQGSEVLSIWGTDVICYGVDLADYIDREFGSLKGVWDDELWQSRSATTVKFWGDLAME